MGDSRDIAFGRLASARGLVTVETVRQVYAALPPGRSLAEALVASGTLSPDDARRVMAELAYRASGPRPVATPPDDATVQLPARPPNGLQPIAAPADDATVQIPARPTSGASPTPRSSSSSGEVVLPEVGEVVGGRYRVGTILGRGGMGAVYRAFDSQLNVDVALKVMLPGEETGNEVARFSREAEAVAKVDTHAGIVRVRGLGEHRGLHFAAMDLVEGQDLKALVKNSGPLPVADALAYTEQAARAIQHCHDKGVLHRDLKPANLLLRSADHNVFVTDFGLALDATKERLTKTGEVMGTPAYMSPEQAEGLKEEIDHRTDVYALGAILYELVTGKTPFEGDAIQILKKIFLDMPKPVRSHRADAPADVDLICMKAMAKEKGVRYRSAKAFADDVARLRAGDPITARPLTLRERYGAKIRKYRGVGVLFAVLVLCLAALAVQGVVNLRNAALFQKTIVVELREFLRGSSPLDSLRSKTDGAELNTKRASSVVSMLVGAEGRERAGGEEMAEYLAEVCRDLGAEADRSLVESLESLESEDDPLALVPLKTLTRRLGFAAGLGDVLPGEDTEEPDEALVFKGLEALGWGRPFQSDAEPWAVDVEGARTALGSALRSKNKTLADAAGRVLSEVAAVDSACAEYLAFGATLARKMGPRLEVGAWPKLTSLHEATQPKLRVYLMDRLRGLKEAGSVDAVNALRETLSRLRGEVPLQKVGACLRKWCGLQQPFLELEDPKLRIVDAKEFRMAMDTLLVELTTLPNGKVPSEAESSEYRKLILLLDRYVVWSEPLQSSCHDLLLHDFRRYATPGNTPPIDLIIMPPRIGSLLPVWLESACKTWSEAGLFEQAAKSAQSGNAYLIWANSIELVGSTRADTPYEAKRCGLMLRCFATALGSSLSDETWQALGLGAERVTLREPLNPRFDAYVRSQVGQYAIRRAGQQLNGAAPNPDVLLAAAELLAGLEGRLKDFSSSRQVLDHCKNGASAIGGVCGSLLAPDSERALRLRKIEGDFYEAGLALAWKRVRMNASGEIPEHLKEGSLQGLGSEFDPTKVLRDLIALVEKQAIWRKATGAHAPVFSGFEEVERWYLDRDRVVPPEVLVSWCEVAFEMERVEDVDSVSERLLSRMQASAPTAPREREKWFEWKEKARGYRANAILRRGDRAGADALYEEAKKDPGHRSLDRVWDAFRTR